MCAPSCCAPPAPSTGGSGTGLFALLTVFPVALIAVTGHWLYALLALVGLVVVIGAGLWLIAAGARRLNRAIHGPGIDTTTTATSTTRSSTSRPGQAAGPVRVQITATDLSHRHPAHRVRQRALTAAEVAALPPARPTWARQDRVTVRWPR